MVISFALMTSFESDIVARYLEQRAAIKKKPISYGVLAKKLKFEPITFWGNHPFFEIFNQLDREDFAAGRPFRTAIAINKALKRPGQGFFASIASIRKLGEPLSDPVEQKAFWEEELRQLLNFYPIKPESKTLTQ